MDTQPSTQHKNIGVLLHLSTFSGWFVPLGNFILPLVFWIVHRKNKFIDLHGRECLNFQISIFLYAIGLIFIGFFGSLIFGIGMSDPIFLHWTDEKFVRDFHDLVPYFIFIGIIAFLLTALLLLDLICVIIASIYASEGKSYRYPISIPFINTKNMAVAEAEKQQEETFTKKESL